MQFIFRRDARETAAVQTALPDDDGQPLHRTALTFAAMVTVLLTEWNGMLL